jgi:integrase
VVVATTTPCCFRSRRAPGPTQHLLIRPNPRAVGVDLVVIKELLGHAHIGVTATVYAHVRLRLQRDAIDLLDHALNRPANDESTRDDGDDPPLCGATVR